MLVIVGLVDGGVIGTVWAWNLIWVCFETLLTTAVTVAVPGLGAVSVTEATPLTVVLISETRAGLLSEKLPKSVANSTAVPSTTGVPFTVTVAVIVDVDATSGVGFNTVKTIVAPTGGVTPPPGGVVPPPPGVGFGAVGDSPLHAASTSNSASSANISFRCLILIMVQPPSATLTHPQRPHPRAASTDWRSLCAAAAVKAEIKRKPRASRYFFSGQRFAEQIHGHIHVDERTTRFRIPASVLCLQGRKRRLRQRVTGQDEEIGKVGHRSPGRDQGVNGPNEGRWDLFPAVCSDIGNAIAGHPDVVETLIRDLRRVLQDRFHLDRPDGLIAVCRAGRDVDLRDRLAVGHAQFNGRARLGGLVP